MHLLQSAPTPLDRFKRVAKVIEREFGVSYHYNHVGRLLRALGFSWKKPRRRAREKDEEPQGHVVADDLEADPKKLMAGATLVFVDESGFALTPSVAKTWAPADEVPVLVHAFGRWEKLSAISGIAVRLRGGRIEAALYFRLLPRKAVRNGDMGDYLRQLSRHLRGLVVVVWDNAG